jgi:hypothetical protein
VVLVVSGLSGVLGAIGRILLSYLVHMHSSLRSLRQGQVHVGPITWEVLPHLAPQKGSTSALEHSGSVPTTGQRFEGWPLGRVQRPPQATRAPRPLLIKGS